MHWLADLCPSVLVFELEHKYCSLEWTEITGLACFLQAHTVAPEMLIVL